jgi:type I restriction enzyme, S subunit
VGKIPKTWQVAPLRDLQSLTRPYLKTGPFGSSLKGEHWVDEGTPVITIGSLVEGAFIQSELLHVSANTAQRLAAYAVRPGDLVFSRVADVGRSVVIRPENTGWIISSNLMWISLDQERVVPDYAYLCVAHSAATRIQIRRSVNAGGRDVANTVILDSLLFSWPERREQEQIVAVYAAADNRIRAEESYRDKLKLQKRGLMQDLLTGRVRV